MLSAAILLTQTVQMVHQSVDVRLGTIGMDRAALAQPLTVRVKQTPMVQTTEPIPVIATLVISGTLWTLDAGLLVPMLPIPTDSTTTLTAVFATLAIIGTAPPGVASSTVRQLVELQTTPMPTLATVNLATTGTTQFVLGTVPYKSTRTEQVALIQLYATVKMVIARKAIVVF